MSKAQTGVFAEGNRYHYHLEYRFGEDVDDEALRRAVAAAAAAPRGTDQHLVLSFGKSAWARLARDPLPGPWSDFTAIRGVDGRVAPATQGDLWLWVQGPRHDENFTVVLALQRALLGLATPTLDLPAFVYLASRDLTGFEDGTANPKGNDRLAAALIPDGAAGAGGSYAITQRWAHDLEGFEALPVERQEAIIGRTKADSIELEGEAMPADSHVSRTDVELDGVAQKIWRRSTPYGTAGEHGLYFIAFACAQRRIQIQLERMYGVSADGLHDRLIEYSRAVSGSYWFTPAAGALATALAGD